MDRVTISITLTQQEGSPPRYSWDGAWLTKAELASHVSHLGGELHDEIWHDVPASEVPAEILAGIVDHLRVAHPNINEITLAKYPPRWLARLFGWYTP